MSEEKKEEKPQIRTIHVKRHLWPDEIEALRQQKVMRWLKVGTVILPIVGILIGWTMGSLMPFKALAELRTKVTGGSVNNKITDAMNLMEQHWYFGKDIENLDERLIDQALIGITTNAEDRHTVYMSAEEAEEFVQSINRNYVGIGVQFLNTGNISMVEKVFKDSPAEKAGVLPGDIFSAVNGTDVSGMGTEDLKNLVMGDEGTNVVIEFLRDGENVVLTLTRGPVNATAYGYALDDETVYVEMYQFGNSSPQEVRGYLEDLAKDGKKDLILDLRNNGGGYLTSLSGVASLFVPDDTLVMKQVYPDESVHEIRSSGEPLENIGDIVILVNERTASAAEVLTLALMEQREGVTVIGTQTYGKGTVQVSYAFADNSNIKYTTSKWTSPHDVWINNVGITPDIEVYLHDANYHSYGGVGEGVMIETDTVSAEVQDMQLMLDYLEYNPGRTDGYFSVSTEEALMNFEEDHGLIADGLLDYETYEALFSAMTVDWNTTHVHDIQLHKAQEILHG